MCFLPLFQFRVFMWFFFFFKAGLPELCVCDDFSVVVCLEFINLTFCVFSNREQDGISLYYLGFLL